MVLNYRELKQINLALYFKISFIFNNLWSKNQRLFITRKGKGADRRAKFYQGDPIVITREIMNICQLNKMGTKRIIRVNRTL